MWKKILCVGIMCVCLGTGIYMVYNDNMQKSNANSETVIDEDVSEAEPEVIEIDWEKWEDELSDTLNQCAEKGNKIAELENEYITADLYDDTIETITDTLQNSYLASSTALLWYAPILTIEYEWQFIQPYEIDADGNFQVIWECKDADENLFAYTTATYNGEKFENIKTATTSYGDDAIVDYAVGEDDIAPDAEDDPFLEEFE